MLLALSVCSVSAVQAQQAQTAPNPMVQFILVDRQAAYVQSGPSTLMADSNQPFVFRVGVEGQGMTSTAPITAASFTGPSNGSMSLTYNSQENRWAFTDSEFSSMAELNSFYGTGAYNVTLTGTPNGTATINVSSFDGTQLQAPLVTLSGGSWMNGIYMITDMASLSVTFNSIYSGTVGTTQAFHYDASLGGMQNNNLETQGFINFDPTTNSSAQLSPVPPMWNVGTLSLGMYSLQIGYDDVQNPGPLFSNTAFGASLLTYRTTVGILVVPEPSTYASLMLGLGLIGLVSWRRSRRA